MWSFGSIRDSIRENAKVAREKAKAAAQVAQDVIQAAAAEDVSSNTDYPRSEHLEKPSESSWPSANQIQSDSLLQVQGDFSNLDVPPPPPDELEPPPTSDKLASSLPPPSPSSTGGAILPPPPPCGLPPRTTKPPRSRPSRYVVTGVNTIPATKESLERTASVLPTATQSLISGKVQKEIASLGKPHSETEHDQVSSTFNLSAPPNDEPIVQPSAGTIESESIPIATSAEEETNGWGFGEEDWAIPHDTPITEPMGSMPEHSTVPSAFPQSALASSNSALSAEPENAAVFEVLTEPASEIQTLAKTQIQPPPPSSSPSFNAVSKVSNVSNQDFHVAQRPPEPSYTTANLVRDHEVSRDNKADMKTSNLLRSENNLETEPTFGGNEPKAQFNYTLKPDDSREIRDEPDTTDTFRFESDLIFSPAPEDFTEFTADPGPNSAHVNMQDSTSKSKITSESGTRGIESKSTIEARVEADSEVKPTPENKPISHEKFAPEFESRRDDQWVLESEVTSGTEPMSSVEAAFGTEYALEIKHPSRAESFPGVEFNPMIGHDSDNENMPDGNKPTKGLESLPQTEIAPTLRPVIEGKLVAGSEALKANKNVAASKTVTEDELVAAEETVTEDKYVIERKPVVEREAMIESEPMTEKDPVMEGDSMAMSKIEGEGEPVAEDGLVADKEHAPDDKLVADKEHAPDDELVTESEFANGAKSAIEGARSSEAKPRVGLGSEILAHVAPDHESLDVKFASDGKAGVRTKSAVKVEPMTKDKVAAETNVAIEAEVVAEAKPASEESVQDKEPLSDALPVFGSVYNSDFTQAPHVNREESTPSRGLEHSPRLNVEFSQESNQVSNAAIADAFGTGVDHVPTAFTESQSNLCPVPDSTACEGAETSFSLTHVPSPSIQSPSQYKKGEFNENALSHAQDDGRNGNETSSKGLKTSESWVGVAQADAPSFDELDDVNWFSEDSISQQNQGSPFFSAFEVSTEIKPSSQEETDFSATQEDDVLASNEEDKNEGQLNSLAMNSNIDLRRGSTNELSKDKIASKIQESDGTIVENPVGVVDQQSEEELDSDANNHPSSLKSKDEESFQTAIRFEINEQIDSVSINQPADDPAKNVSDSKDGGFAPKFDDFPDQNHSTSEIQNCKKEMDTFSKDRENTITQTQQTVQDVESLHQTIEVLRQEIFEKNEHCSHLAHETQVLKSERDTAVEEKLIAEKERDFAVERGGDGLREARSVIEELQNGRATAEAREDAVAHEVDSLRSQLDRLSDERNQLVNEASSLQDSLREIQSGSKSKADEMSQRIKIVETEAEIAKYEREKAIESNNILKEELQNLRQLNQEHVSALANRESHVKDLEIHIQSRDRFREEEAMRIDAFTKLVEEMKDRTRGIIEERNTLHEEKTILEKEREEMRSHQERQNRQLADVQREMSSLVGERDDCKQACESLREQIREAIKRHDVVSAERDRLVKERTAEVSNSDKEKILATECEQKTRAIAVLQRKLTSASSKIEKLTVQRGTFQRQRDDAGMRLRAAGAEFVSLNTRLEQMTAARDNLQNQVVALRDDRDSALTNVQELAELKPKVDVLEERIQTKENDLEQMKRTLQEERRTFQKTLEDLSSAEHRSTTLSEELDNVRRRLDVVIKEKDLLQSRIDKMEPELEMVKEEMQQIKIEKSSLESKYRDIEAKRVTEKEKAERDLTLADSKLKAEQKEMKILQERLSICERDSIVARSVEDEVRKTLTNCFSSAQSILSDSLQHEGNAMVFTDLSEALSTKDLSKSISDLVLMYCEAVQIVFDEHSRYKKALEDLKVHYSQVVSQLQQSHSEIQDLRRVADDASRMNLEMNEACRRAEIVEVEKVDLNKCIVELREKLQRAQEAEDEFNRQLQAMQDQMKLEFEESAGRWATERVAVEQRADSVVVKLQSIWNMLERSLGSEQVQGFWEDAEYDEGSETERIGVVALRATASIVAEVDRKRSETDDLAEKLGNAEAEVAKLIDRAEIAEQERDALRATVERVEKKASKAHEAGQEEVRSQYEGLIVGLEDELGETRDQVLRMTDKANRSENETGELRALCKKITAQLNGRTNELDEAEEKLAYLQDQVTTLEEDLQEAHRRLKEAEEASTQSRRHDVERLTRELDERTGQLERIEEECTTLRTNCDEAEKKAKESEILAQTHQQAEENLQIAIEQLEASQESAVEQRTIELEKGLRNFELKYKEACDREKAAMVTQNQLTLRDDEIKELRGAIGRLSDERVELKLELERSLSRLNHPDAVGQLVDRRVVRQLLVSYFRVGSVRRRDVLELMSRMLAFSEADNVAVGLKRRALMDRIGSLVQPPELDDATLPPLGTVSDKWIEFLMKETEDGEDQSRGW